MIAPESRPLVNFVTGNGDLTLAVKILTSGDDLTIYQRLQYDINSPWPVVAGVLFPGR